MRARNIPFYIVVASTFMAPIGSALNIWLFNVPLLFCVLGVVVLLGTKAGAKLYPVGKGLLFSWAFLAFLAIVQVFRGNGFEILSLGGQLVIFTVFFLQFIGKDSADVEGFSRQISTIYKIHLVALIVEAILVAAGFQNTLGSIFTGFPVYKTYNPADVLRLILPQVGGLNSILLGSQGASMVSLFALLWFADPLRLGNNVRLDRSRAFWSLVAVLLFAITYTQTAIVLLLLSILLFVYVIRGSRLNRPINKIAVIPTLILGLGFIRSFFFKRVSQAGELIIQGSGSGLTRAQYYFIAFVSPAYLWWAQGAIDKLFGATSARLEFADSGYLVSVYAVGLLWVIALTILIGVVCFRSFRLLRSQSNPSAAYSKFAAINGLLTLLWFLSIGHYLAAYSIGGVELFAFHFALTIHFMRLSCEAAKNGFAIQPVAA